MSKLLTVGVSFVVSLAAEAHAQEQADPPATAPAERTVRLPDRTLAWVAIAEGGAVGRSLDVWISGLELSPAIELLLGAGRIAMWRATGHRDLGAAATSIVPAPVVLGLVAPEGAAPVPFLLLDDGVDIDRLKGLAPSARSAPLDDGWTLIAGPNGFDSIRSSLTADTTADDARARIPTAGRVRAEIDVAAVRTIRRPPDRLPPPALFLVGPLLDAWKHASVLTAELSFPNARDLALDVDLDGSVNGAPTHAILAGDAEPDPVPATTVGSLTVSRSLFELLSRREQLLTRGQAAQIGGGLSIADALAAGSFVDDLLGAVDGPMTLHVLPALQRRDDGSELDDDLFESPLSLPGFVLTAPIASDVDTDALRSQVHQTFTKFVFAASVQRRQNGEVAYRSRRNTTDDDLVFATALPDQWRGPLPAPAAATLSPSVAIAHGRIVLASTETAARTWLDHLSGAELPTGRGNAGRTGTAGTEVPTDRLHLHGPSLAALGEANQRVLEFNQIIDEGRTPADARRRMRALIDIVGALEELDVQVRFGAERTAASLLLRAKR